jgi:hypothetical protein
MVMVGLSIAIQPLLGPLAVFLAEEALVLGEEYVGFDREVKASVAPERGETI